MRRRAARRRHRPISRRTPAGGGRKDSGGPSRPAQAGLTQRRPSHPARRPQPALSRRHRCWRDQNRPHRNRAGVEGRTLHQHAIGVDHSEQKGESPPGAVSQCSAPSTAFVRRSRSALPGRDHYDELRAETAGGRIKGNIVLLSGSRVVDRGAPVIRDGELGLKTESGWKQLVRTTGGGIRHASHEETITGWRRGDAGNSISLCLQRLKCIRGGGTGIRTQERVSPLTVFKTAAFDRSAIPPFSARLAAWPARWSPGPACTAAARRG